jgi:hypothetical protein
MMKTAGLSAPEAFVLMSLPRSELAQAAALGDELRELAPATAKHGQDSGGSGC